jgi:hypothetical protein
MVDLGRFKECLTSATFVLQVHREDLHKRAFSLKNVDELKAIRAVLPATGAGAAAAAKGVPQVLGGSDLFIVQCIDRAIASASEVSPHGTARFRLEDLLSSSADLLAEFALRHAGKDHPDADTAVVVREDMLLEVRLGKPSRPPKVAKPSDISLRSALLRAQESERERAGSRAGTPRGTAPGTAAGTTTGTGGSGSGSGSGSGAGSGSGTSSSGGGIGTGGGIAKKTAGLGDTLAGTIMGRGVVVPSGITHKARHEQFFECGTRLSLSAELHRRLTHPTDTPKALPDELFKIREQRQFSDHFTTLANRTDTALGFRTTMIPPRGGYGTSLVNEELLNETMNSTVSLHPTKMQLLGSSLGLAFDTLNFDLFMTDELQSRLDVTPFTRMVIVFRYDDDDTLLQLNDAIAKVNRLALPDIQGSLRSYALDETEIEACATGSLDLVTGVMVIDDDLRMIVLEGLAMPGGGMQSIFMDLPRPKENDTHFKMLCNPEVLFPDRLYPTFGPELKRVRLRDRLKKLTRRPELYNRKQVDEVCFEAFDTLMTLRRAQDLKSTKDLRMYPSCESLNTLELLYGEAVSRADLDGLAAEARRVATLEQKRLEKVSGRVLFVCLCVCMYVCLLLCLHECLFACLRVGLRPSVDCSYCCTRLVSCLLLNDCRLPIVHAAGSPARRGPRPDPRPRDLPLPRQRHRRPQRDGWDGRGQPAPAEKERAVGLPQRALRGAPAHPPSPPSRPPPPPPRDAAPGVGQHAHATRPAGTRVRRDPREGARERGCPGGQDLPLLLSDRELQNQGDARDEGATRAGEERDVYL